MTKINLEEGDFVRNKSDGERFTVEKIFNDTGVVHMSGEENESLAVVLFSRLAKDFEVASGKHKRVTKPYEEARHDEILDYRTSSGQTIEIVTLNGCGLRPIKGYIGENDYLTTWYPNGRGSIRPGDRDIYCVVKEEVFEPIVVTECKSKTAPPANNLDIDLEELADKVADILKKRLRRLVRNR